MDDFNSMDPINRVNPGSLFLQRLTREPEASEVASLPVLRDESGPPPYPTSGEYCELVAFVLIFGIVLLFAWVSRR